MDKDEAESADEKLKCANELLHHLKCFERRIDGIDKLERRIKREMHSLNSASATASGRSSRHQLRSSNLAHFKAIINVLKENARNAVAVLKKVDSLTIDLAIRAPNDALTWIKVSARNPKALHESAKGETNFGKKSIFEHAKEMLKCAERNPALFRPPNVVFVFAMGVFKPMADVLQGLGVQVEGDIIKNHELYEVDSPLRPFTTESGIGLDDGALNLDVSTMIAYVSALTNGSAYAKFNANLEPVLAQQAQWEQRRPVIVALDALFAGKRLLCCKSAKNDFEKIVLTVGGFKERQRAEKLLARVQVVDDAPSTRISSLALKGKIRARSKIIFGTGDAFKVMTVSANAGFVRSAAAQNVTGLAVFTHESRALAEAKLPTIEISKNIRNDMPTEDGVTVITRDISYDEFFQSYALVNRPCLIRNGTIDEWPSFRDWRNADGTPNLDVIAKIVKTSNEKLSVTLCGDQRCVAMTFIEYLDYWKSSERKNRVCYLKDWHFYRQCPHYKAYSTPSFFSSDFLNEVRNVMKSRQNEEANVSTGLAGRRRLPIRVHRAERLVDAASSRRLRQFQLVRECRRRQKMDPFPAWPRTKDQHGETSTRRPTL